jgi:hypothetical protein
MKSFLLPMISKTLTLSGFVASVMFAASPAQAVIFNVGGTNYDITLVGGSYNSLKTQLEATPWWNNLWLAQNVAGVVKDRLGTPNLKDPNVHYDILGNPFFDARGPWFAFTTSFLAGGPSVDLVEGVYTFDAMTGEFVRSQLQSDYGYFAVAPSAVPWETDALPVVGSTFFFGLGLWGKHKLAQSSDS